MQRNIEKELIEKKNFRSIADLNQELLNDPGFYCIKLNTNSKLPKRYQSILDTRKHQLIYIGKAEGQSLKERLAQELELKRPGTFFRSIGCVLNYQPIKGHLIGNSNQNNYKFSNQDKTEIIHWLRTNVEISVVRHNQDFSIEKDLIKKYCPLLNHTHNPLKLQQLVDDKKKCREIARGNNI